MKNKVILVEMLIDKIEQYCKTSIELFRLKAIDKGTDVFASVAARFIILIVVTLFFLFFTIGLALYLGDIMGKMYFGFFAVSAFYIVIAIILFIIRKPYLEDTFNNYLVNEIFKEKKDADNQRQ